MKKLASLALFLVLIALSGCAAPEGYESTVLEGQEAAAEGSLLGAIVNQWRLFTVIFLMISISIVALAYPIANAFNMPDVRAWADVELGEAFTTALIVIAVLAVLVFAEVVAHSYLITSGHFDGVCSNTNEYCPALVARAYIESYIKSSEGIYEDIQANAIRSGKLAMTTMGVGIQYFVVGFPSVSFRPFGGELIIVNAMVQQFSFLSTLRDAMFFQEFLINHVSLMLAPTALMLGIILRTFFATRKLGGQLMAFGIGFLLVYPATYAIAMYTIQTTVYGAEGSGGQVGGEFCTQTCMTLPPLAYNTSDGKGLTRSAILREFPQSLSETEEEYEQRINSFINGSICSNVDILEGEICTETTSGGDMLATCGIYDEACPLFCRTLPYPNVLPECSSWRTEFMCREHVPEGCFIIKYIDVENDPQLSGLAPEDFEGCPEECRPLIGLKKDGCHFGYGVYLDDAMEEDPYLFDQTMLNEAYASTTKMDNVLINWCQKTQEKLVCDYTPMLFGLPPICWKEPYTQMECRDEWLPEYYSKKNTSYILERFFDYTDVQVNYTIEWDMGCPNQCRFMTTSGNKPFGCTMCKSDNYPTGPQELWEQASSGGFEGQIAAAEQSCVMIIPDIVYNNPSECAGCNYVIDKGFGAYPPVHLDCPRLCGMKGGVSMESDKASFTSKIGGFTGSAEMKSIAGLIVPALILPLLNLVITFMFINTLSPMLGGAADFQGLMRFFR